MSPVTLPALSPTPTPVRPILGLCNPTAFAPFGNESAHSFTLVELMAATTVLSFVLLLMVGMQDQMSRAWSNANQRTDATREARSACNLMAADFSFPIVRGNSSLTSKDQIADSTTNFGLPFLYSSNGANLGFSIPGQQSNSSAFFCVTSQRSRGTTNPVDLALVGYYVASSSNTNVNGFVTESYNLHRYYCPAPNAWSNLVNWFATKSAASLFTNVSPNNDDILARNVANFRVVFYYNSSKPITNGVNYTNAGGGQPYTGNKMQVSLDIYPGDVAQKFPSLNNWLNPTNIQRFARAYEFRVDSPRE